MREQIIMQPFDRLLHITGNPALSRLISSHIELVNSGSNEIVIIKLARHVSHISSGLICVSGNVQVEVLDAVLELIRQRRNRIRFAYNFLPATQKNDLMNQKCIDILIADEISNRNQKKFYFRKLSTYYPLVFSRVISSLSIKLRILEPLIFSFINEEEFNSSIKYDAFMLVIGKLFKYYPKVIMDLMKRGTNRMNIGNILSYLFLYADVKFIKMFIKHDYDLSQFPMSYDDSPKCLYIFAKLRGLKNHIYESFGLDSNYNLILHRRYRGIDHIIPRAARCIYNVAKIVSTAMINKNLTKLALYY